MILLCFMLLAITGDGLLSQKPVLVAYVRVSAEKLCLDDVKQSSFSKEFSEHILWMNIVYVVKIHDIKFILCFS